MRKLPPMPCVALILTILASTDGVAGSMILSSPDIHDGAPIANEQVFNRFGCTGQNISPALSWHGAPATTRSFALTVYDPDTPTAAGWWHWIAFDIPRGATSLPRNAGDLATHLGPPGSIQGRNDFGTLGLGGPCPPQGDRPHRYVFTVYALDVDRLPVSHDASPTRIAANIRMHVLDQVSLTGLYGRQ